MIFLLPPHSHLGGFDCTRSTALLYVCTGRKKGREEGPPSTLSLLFSNAVTASEEEIFHPWQKKTERENKIRTDSVERPAGKNLRNFWLLIFFLESHTLSQLVIAGHSWSHLVTAGYTCHSFLLVHLVTFFVVYISLSHLLYIFLSHLLYILSHLLYILSHLLYILSHLLYILSHLLYVLSHLLYILSHLLYILSHLLYI